MALRHQLFNRAYRPSYGPAGRLVGTFLIGIAFGRIGDAPHHERNIFSRRQSIASAATDCNRKFGDITTRLPAMLTGDATCQL